MKHVSEMDDFNEFWLISSEHIFKNDNLIR